MSKEEMRLAGTRTTPGSLEEALSALEADPRPSSRAATSLPMTSFERGSTINARTKSIHAAAPAHEFHLYYDKEADGIVRRPSVKFSLSAYQRHLS